MAVVKEPNDEGHQAGFRPVDEQGGQVSEVIGNLTTLRRERKKNSLSKEQHTKLCDVISFPENLCPQM